MDFGREKTLISQNWMGREGWTWPWALGKVTVISNLDGPGSLDMAVGLGEGNSDLKPGWAGKVGHGRGPWGR